MASPLTATEEALVTQNPTLRFMGGSTTGEGLARYFGDTIWPVTQGQLGTDFGATTPDGLLASGTGHPNWNNPFVRIVTGSPSLSGYLVPGGVEVFSSDGTAIIVDNCHIDGTTARVFRNIQKTNFPATAMTVQNCTINGAAAQCVLMNSNSTYKKLYLYDSDGDAFTGSGDNIVVDQCFARMLGRASGAHADVFQHLGGSGFRILRSTFYMPFSGSTYDEGTNGSTGALLLSADGTDPNLALTSGLIAGNLLIGGGYTAQLSAKISTQTVSNICFVNNRFGGPTYYGYGAFHMGGLASPGFVRKNILFSGNKMQDGSALKQDGVELDGIWNFDKAALDPLTRYIGEKVGFLDSNGDPKAGWSRSV